MLRVIEHREYTATRNDVNHHILIFDENEKLICHGVYMQVQTDDKVKSLIDKIIENKDKI